jgi:hypothetical protein
MVIALSLEVRVKTSPYDARDNVASVNKITKLCLPGGLK